MEAILGGMRYDTEKSTLVLGHDDHDKIYKQLCVTDNGRWFLCVPVLNTIQPMTDREALSYLENYGKTSLIETYFHRTIRDA